MTYTVQTVHYKYTIAIPSGLFTRKKKIMPDFKDVMTVCVVNFMAVPGQVEHNLRRMLGYAEAAARQGADLVLFPELSLQGYDFYVDASVGREEKIRRTETIDGASCGRIERLARERGILIVFGMGEKDADGSDALYNSAVAYGPVGFLGRYRKIHPFGEENRWFAKGDAPLLLTTEWGPIGVGICYDTYQFPELFRHYANHGARLCLNPTAVVEEVDKRNSRQAFANYYYPTLSYAVLCNTIYVASANLCGKGTVNYFAGGSLVVGPKITPFFETDVHIYAGDPDDAQQRMFTATIDLSLATRRLFTDNPITGTPDFRPDLYRNF